MNILFFSRRFYPEIGGVEKHILELSKQLIALGHRVTVVSEIHEKQNVASFEKETGIIVLKIPVGKGENQKKRTIWKWLWKHKMLIEKADVVHCHDVFFWFFPFRFLYPNKPVFTTFHGYESYPVSKKAIAVRKLSETLSWGNICIGDFIPKWYGTKSTYVSYGAVDSAKFKFNKDLQFKNESALFFGRLDEQTGIQTYVDAFEILKKKFPKFQLSVIGEGKYKKRIEKKVDVLGFKKNPEAYLSKYHFVFVSRYLSILEAFAAKKLVFAVFDNKIKEDYLTMAPFKDFIITANTPEKLARKVTYILHNPKMEKQMIDAAYTWVQKQSWRAMAKLYLKLWKKRK